VQFKTKPASWHHLAIILKLACSRLQATSGSSFVAIRHVSSANCVMCNMCVCVCVCVVRVCVCVGVGVVRVCACVGVGVCVLCVCVCVCQVSPRTLK
jgi:hypothetical protein